MADTHDDIARKAAAECDRISPESTPWRERAAAIIQRAIDETVRVQQEKIAALEAELAARGDAEPFGYVHPDGIFRRNKVPPGYERDWTAVYAAPPAKPQQWAGDPSTQDRSSTEKPPGERVLLFRSHSEGDEHRWRQSQFDAPSQYQKDAGYEYRYATLDSEEA